MSFVFRRNSLSIDWLLCTHPLLDLDITRSVIRELFLHIYPSEKHTHLHRFHQQGQSVGSTICGAPGAGRGVQSLVQETSTGMDMQYWVLQGIEPVTLVYGMVSGTTRTFFHPNHRQGYP